MPRVKLCQRCECYSCRSWSDICPAPCESMGGPTCDGPVSGCNLYLGPLAPDPHRPGEEPCKHLDSEIYFDQETGDITQECHGCGRGQLI